MELVYLSLPELSDKRHIILGDRHIINTAARPGNVYFYGEYQRKQKPIEKRKQKKMRAPR